MSVDPYGSGQLVHFLHTSAAGLPNLVQVLALHETTKRVAGITVSTTFTDDVAAPVQQAQVCNAGHGNCQTSTRCPQRSANCTKRIFDDNPVDSHETNGHNLITSS
jgi:hypothetical protein